MGRSTGPADRASTEHLIAGLYRRQHRRAPAFRWVDSPRKALPLLTGMPTHRDLQSWVLARRPQGTPPLAGDIATGLARLRGALDDAATHPDLTATVKKSDKDDRHKPWPQLPPVQAIEAGVPLREVLRQSLHTPIAAGITWPVRAVIGPQGTLPVCWYGQQDVTWIGLYDMLRKLGLAQYRAHDADQLDGWAALARAAGWWWPGEDVCVLVERPVLIGPRRVGYRDGATVSW
ncbi:hypothetical protein OHA72_32985 [Dactylosporangium sp. NBC_01737]|uniref:DUF6745 domain-containing protein n=1 Tax=Dactylosporangium sp. NBC_01737 TaxID=2975959 RepID=UPI002E12436C|nr:hypothetical protein OHA72_32985 [Dactylosporangium sp. NBC_01737]